MADELSTEDADLLVAARSDPRRRLAGRYLLLRELGSGTYGAVHAAWDEARRRLVAVKVLTRADDRAAERFRREGAALARLRHPGIVAVLDQGEGAGGLPFLVMDLVRGRSLLDLIASGALEPHAAARLVRDVALAVQHAHERGVLHRDLKPHNVLVDPAGRPVVVDFGLVRFEGGPVQSLTAEGASLGTFAYMPPEQTGGHGRQVDARSDVYALGATLYHALADAPPFEGGLAQVVLATLRETPRPPSARSVGVPAALDAVCLRCLEKDPGRRFPSAQALAEALDAALPGSSPPRLGRETLAPPEVPGRETLAPPDGRETVAPPGDLAPPAGPLHGCDRRQRGRKTAAPSGGPTVPAPFDRSEPGPRSPGGRTWPALVGWAALGLAFLAACVGVVAWHAGPASVVPPESLPQATTQSTPPSTPPASSAQAAPAAAALTPSTVDAPTWFGRLETERRPSLPLPAGVRFGVGEEEYVHERTGIVLVWVPAGEFRMGQEGLAEPVHEVRFKSGFFLGKYEVTRGQFQAFCAAMGRTEPECPPLADERHPVVNVSWKDARAFCRWARLRLPSEAEWEYAARGIDGRTYPWGQEDPGTSRCNLAAPGNGFTNTAPVGFFPAGVSPFGALDLAGNVWEWVEDAYQHSYQGTPADGSPCVSEAAGRVYRGGGWNSGPNDCRAATRRGNDPAVRSDHLGFRAVCDR